ncbi:MAG: hypothetical protein OXU27_07945 [Candidatus Poribacteria bacterium]|nr:hypothetical protein [Candidatus Poribacteria bacterium]
MKKSDVPLEELSVNAADPNLADNKVTVENNDIPSPKEDSGSVPPPDYTLEELLANVPEPNCKTLASSSSEEVDTGKPVGKEVW